MNGCFRVSAKAGGTAGRGWVRTGGAGWNRDRLLWGAKSPEELFVRLVSCQARTASSCSVPRAQYNLKCKGSTLPVW